MPYFIVILLLMAGCGGKPEPEGAGASSTEKQPSSAAVKPVDNRPVIVAFGDSLTAGFGAEHGSSYPDFLQKDLDQAGYRYRVVNAGISGDTTTDGLARVSSVLAYDPVIVILEFGGNDGLRGLPVATTRTNLERMIVSIQKSGANVVLAGMTLPPNYGPDYIRSFARIYPELAARCKLELIPFLLEGVAGTNLMQRDGLHPKAEGNRIVARNVMEVLKKLL